ncbi:restriction endonuclease subunit S [Rheinheimera sp. D18]|uniref:restriction endonuclease subunit S n=1 Tax=Rheinheimera sp. D18 TaxID=2545632 RepID=UPI001A9E5DEA|nr:restriction endonuclease subunit S [Rheinheimera sp. D18]
MTQGWSHKKLGEVCVLQRGFDLPKGDRKSGLVPLISSSGRSDYHDEAKVKGPGVVTGRSGSIGKVFFIEEDFWPLNTTLYVKEFYGNYPRFVAYLLNSFDLSRYTSGAGVPTLNRNHVHDELVFVPESVEEQKRIVAILDQAFADIDQARATAEANLKNTRELFDSYLQQVFNQRGEGWSQLTLGEIGRVSMCKRVLKAQTSSSGDIPFFKIGTFGKEPDAFISRSMYEDFKAKYSYPKLGDILLSASGTIGRRVIYDGKPAYFQDSNIVWIDNDERLVLNNYLYHFYGICDWNPSKGATISRLYNDDLRRIKISFPAPNIQKQLVKNISLLSEKIEIVQANYVKKLDSLDELKKSILQKAFTGELTKSKGIAA